MFFPLGLGNKPKVLPIAVMCLMIFTFYYSSINFALVESLEEDKTFKTLTDEVVELRMKTILEACAKSLSKNDCKELGEIITEREIKATRSPASEKKKKLRETASLKETIEYAERMDRLVDFLGQFRAEPKEWPVEAKKTASFGKIEPKLEEIKDLTSKMALEKGFLSRSNYNLVSLTKATFMHGGWLHLISNFIMLVIFGIYLEQRVGFAVFGMLFLVGSYIGLSTEIFLGRQGTVLGASAGLMAVMGAFYILFIHAKLRFWFSFLVYNRTFYLPILYTMPLFFFASDIAAIADRNASDVAHLAHIGGLTFGIIVGLIERKLNPVPAPFLYIEEVHLLSKIKQSNNFEESFKALQDVAKWNSQNEAVSIEVVKELERWKPQLTELQVKTVINWSHLYLASRLEKRYFPESSVFLKDLSSCFTLSAVIKDLRWQNLIQLADYSLEKGYLKSAYDIYCYLLMAQPYNPALKGLDQTCKNIEHKLRSEELCQPQKT